MKKQLKTKAGEALAIYFYGGTLEADSAATEQSTENPNHSSPDFDLTSIENEIKEIDTKALADLQAQQGFFSLEDQDKIQELAAEKTLSAFKKSPRSLLEIWNEQIVHFHQNKYWGFVTQSQKPKKELNEEQKINREVFSYVWAFIQSMIILKYAIYYFGLDYADKREPTTLILLILAIITSFGSLVFFAYRKTKQEKRNSTAESLKEK